MIQSEAMNCGVPLVATSVPDTSLSTIPINRDLSPSSKLHGCVEPAVGLLLDGGTDVGLRVTGAAVTGDPVGSIVGCFDVGEIGRAHV